MSLNKSAKLIPDPSKENAAKLQERNNHTSIRQFLEKLNKMHLRFLHKITKFAPSK